MKSKLYSLSIIALFLFTLGASAQCTVTFTATPSGLMLSATATGVGMATVPTYGWDWGDATSPSIGQTQSHTYATAGTYIVCSYYFDLLDTATCNAQSCQTITVSATGITSQNMPSFNVAASPNPFSSELNINITLPESQKVEMIVYDVTGKEVAFLQNGTMVSGISTINWKPVGLSEGVYFLQVKTGDIITTKKIVFTSAN